MDRSRITTTEDIADGTDGTTLMLWLPYRVIFTFSDFDANPLTRIGRNLNVFINDITILVFPVTSDIYSSTIAITYIDIHSRITHYDSRITKAATIDFANTGKRPHIH